MATIQKYFAEKDNNGKSLFFYDGKKVYSEEYTADIERKTLAKLGVTVADRIDDCKGIDGRRTVIINGKPVEITIQLKIMHNGKTSETLSRLYDAIHKSPDDADHDIFRSALWEYASRFDELVLYMGNSNIGTPFDDNSIVIIKTKLAIYQCLYLRCYRGYAAENFAQCQFNKTMQSDLTAEFLTIEQAEKWRQNVLNHIEFIGTNKKRQNFIINKYFSFNSKQTFKK